MATCFSRHSPQEVLAALIDQTRPDRVLYVGQGALPALEAYRAAHTERTVTAAKPGLLEAEMGSQRYDLALFADCFEHMSKRDGQQLLGGVRNLNASRIMVLVDLAATEWRDTDFFALALQVNARFQREDQVLTLYGYDLLEYKQAPDWLNAKFWANPENFGKYWW
ncbi:DUF6231 family protein [Pseudomonas matsuisoli]|uniref:DUF6231 family protein n=1 Tax=Pseudomonas matsuisoli TaxID=1515666 RepID=UPI00166E4489|nr:DUF6231 family protein [Pseudomonas matsuisoli]